MAFFFLVKKPSRFCTRGDYGFLSFLIVYVVFFWLYYDAHLSQTTQGRARGVLALIFRRGGADSDGTAIALLPFLASTSLSFLMLLFVFSPFAFCQ